MYYSTPVSGLRSPVFGLRSSVFGLRSPVFGLPSSDFLLIKEINNLFKIKQI